MSYGVEAGVKGDGQGLPEGVTTGQRRRDDRMRRGRRRLKMRANKTFLLLSSLQYTCKWASYGFGRTKWHGSNNCKVVMAPT
jgi:hypothetical protein